MSTARKTGEVGKMGIGAMLVRGAMVTAAGGLLYAGVISPVMHWARQDNAVIEPGYVNPKSLSVQSKKNAQGNIEAYIQYKAGDESVSLPCKKGPSGPLCGTVEYWWQSIGAERREELAVDEWPSISNNSKHSIMSSELQTILDTFYGPQASQKGALPKTQQPQYTAGKK